MAVSAQEVDVRGTVTNVGVSQFTWDNFSFPGFYYDVDKNLGAETITFSLSNSTATGATLSDQPGANNNRGVVYKTHSQLKKFNFKPWGQYNVIGFLADKYFAAYDPTVTMDVANANESVAFLYNASKNRNLMTNEQISRVLMDDNKEMTITSANPLQLAHGYQLAIKSIDINGNKAYLELSKNDQVVDSKVIQPSISNAKMSDKTYYYKVDLGDTKEILQIAIHFKNAFRGADTNIATVDGEFQLSDTVTPLKSEQQYDKMSIRNVNPTDMIITMDNKDNQVTLSKNKDVVLMQKIYIKTADQDTIDANSPLRYYMYKKYTEPGSYQLRGSVANLGQNVFTWDNSSFSGFYYDIDKNLGAEKLTFKLANANPASATLSDQADANNQRGITYTTQAQPKNFKFRAWGRYEVIGFLADRYFAAYDNTVTQSVTNANETVAFIFDKSKNRNLMTNEQISKVLVDDNKEMTITSASPLMLQEGYQLALKTVDVKGNKAYLELSKNDRVVDSKAVQPSIDNAKMTDKTYFYKVDLGDTKEIVQIAVHFKNAFAGSDTNIATVDGEFQISDTPTTLKSEQQYDKMSIRNVNPTDMTITMDNKDNQITLSKNKDVVLMQDIHIKTADQDGTDVAPLRYYIYKAASIAAANVVATTGVLFGGVPAATPAAAPAAKVTMNVIAPAATPAPGGVPSANIVATTPIIPAMQSGETAANVIDLTKTTEPAEATPGPRVIASAAAPAANVTAPAAEKPSGCLLWNPPEKMMRGVEEDINAVIDIKNCTKDLIGTYSVGGRSPKYENYSFNKQLAYKLNLNGGSDFNIIPPKEEILNLSDKPSEWLWYVTPLTEGNHTLILEVYRLENKYPTYHEELKRTVHIEVKDPSLSERAMGFMSTTNLIITFLIGLCTLLVLVRKVKKGDKDND